MGDDQLWPSDVEPAIACRVPPLLGAGCHARLPLLGTIAGCHCRCYGGRDWGRPILTE